MKKVRTTKIINNFKLALIMTLCLVAPDYILKIFGFSKTIIDTEFLPLLYGMMFGLTFLPKAFAFILIALFFIMDAVQLHYMVYFGFPMHIFDVGNVISEAFEIVETGLGSYKYVWFVMPIMLLSYAVAFCAYFKKREVCKKSYWALLILLPCLLYIPNRGRSKPITSFYPWATRTSLHNSMNVFSWYFIRGVDKSFEQISFAPYEARVNPAHKKAKNILIILGESTNYNHFGLFGYERDTTPKLSEISRTTPSFIYKKGVSTSVATKDSLPLFFNSIREPCNLKQLRSGESNMFKLARDAGYKTYYISAQDSRVVDSESIKNIDYLWTKETHRLTFLNRRDEALLEFLPDINLEEGGNFIVFFMRSIHSPYENNYRHRREFAVYPESGKDRDEYLKNTYDNATLYNDSFYEKAISAFAKRAGENSMIFFTSDHGEMLGERNIYGHTFLDPGVAEVPFMYHALGNENDEVIREVKDEEYVIQYEINKMILRKMGYDLINPNEKHGEYFISGPSIYQQCRLIKIIKNQDKSLSFSESMNEDFYKKAKTEIKSLPAKD